jgi:hypothetical protein
VIQFVPLLVIEYAPAPKGAQDSNFLTLLGSMYTCLSVIVVFQMFTLQMWLQDTQELRKSAWDTDVRSMAVSLERDVLVERLDSQADAFPSIQVAFLGGGMILICIVGLFLAKDVYSLALIYTGGPIIILLALFVGVTVTIRAKGMKILKAAREQIRPPDVGQRQTS